MIGAKAFRTFIRICFLYKSERLSANIKLTLYKALIRRVLIYDYPVWELAAGTYLLTLQRMQNNVLRTIGNFSSCALFRDLHTTFSPPDVYDYVTKLCRRQTVVIRNHENDHIRGIEKGEARHEKYKRFKLGGWQAYDLSND
jgi:hypothetical protein